MRRARVLRIVGALLMGAGLLLCEGAGRVCAQQNETVTLHVYPTLVEIPVLVLSSSREPLPPVDPRTFSVSLNSGRQFRPMHVRREGDDPLTLAILLDQRGGDAEVLRALPGAVAALAGSSLRPKDRVLIYTFNCNLRRFSYEPPMTAAWLEQSMERAIAPHPDTVAGCSPAVHLWDASAYAAVQLGKLPGRRVLLVVTAGHDDGSGKTWADVKGAATTEGVTVFALSAAKERRSGFAEFDNEMQAVCELSGGMRLWSSAGELPAVMPRFIETLRERYIVDFPRPDSMQAGKIDLRITLGKRKAFIRPSGALVTIQDPAILKDPTTIPSDPARAAPVGSRRILPPS